MCYKKKRVRECPAGPIELRYGQEKIAALLAMTIMPIYDLRPERQLRVEKRSRTNGICEVKEKGV